MAMPEQSDQQSAERQGTRSGSAAALRPTSLGQEEGRSCAGGTVPVMSPRAAFRRDIFGRGSGRGRSVVVTTEDTEGTENRCGR